MPSVTLTVVSRYTDERWSGVLEASMFTPPRRDVFVRLESNQREKRALGFLARRHDSGWIEIVIANCLSDCPIGYQEVQILAISEKPEALGKDLLWSTSALFVQDKWIGLADQTGYAFVYGKPTWSEAAREMTPGDWPVEGPGERALNWWGSPDPRGEDHIPDTHRTGSPRNKYMTWYEAAWKYQKERSEEIGVPSVLMRYVCEQWGTSYEAEEGAEVFHIGRPYHLLSPQGIPITRIKPDTPKYRTNEGVIRLRKDSWSPIGWETETFGREVLPIWDPYNHPDKNEAWDRERWVGKRIKGGLWSKKDQMSSDGKVNGWDHEHMHVEELAFAANSLDSLLAKNSLISLMSGLVCPSDEWKKYGDHVLIIRGMDHSSRAYGWSLRAYGRWMQVMGKDDNFLWAARQMRDVARFRWENGLMPDWVPEEQRKLLFLSRMRQTAFQGRWIDEACWQAATISSACFLWSALDEEESHLWDELAFEALEPVLSCYVQGEGFYENVTIKENEPVTHSGVIEWLSTRHWNIDPLAEAYRKSNDHKYEEPGKEGWTYLKSRRSYPTFYKDDEHGWKWHKNCAALWGW